MIKFTSVALSIALLSSLSMAQAGKTGPVVRVSGGEIRGTLSPGGGASFKGIPFAQPPVGDLRWRDPAPVKPWQGVRDASSFGAPCTQEESEFYPHSAANGSKEDCLYLNVWTPEWPAKSPKAVMVWLYGGSNIIGTAALDFYDGTALSRNDVVVVTINYRLGVFGFFAHPGLTSDSKHQSSGNYGLLDQLAALKWVHENIARMGGDPQRVTLFGQSSGSIDTSYIVASPLSKGLVQRAIEESGPPFRPIDPLKEDEQLGEKFAGSLGAPSNPAEAVKYLRSLPTAEIEKAAASKLGSDAVPLERPLIDGYLIPTQPPYIYRDGKDLPIPLMIGNNSQETNRKFDASMLRRWIKDNYGSLAPKAEEFYGLANGGTGRVDPFWGPSYIEVRADVRDRCPAIAQGIWRVANDHPTYEYMWDPAIAGEPATRHGAEIPFVFGNLLTSGVYGGPYTEADKRISAQAEAYWTNFAKTGDPNGPGLPTWPAFTTANRPYLEFTAHNGPVAKENLRRDICDMYVDAIKETVPANTAGNYPK